MPDDLILILDDDDELLVFDDDREIELEDSYPFARGGTPYEGSYEDVSVFNRDKVIQTQNKIMMQNFIVRKIPVTDTVNPYGGRTVVIG